MRMASLEQEYPSPQREPSRDNTSDEGTHGKMKLESRRSNWCTCFNTYYLLHSLDTEDASEPEMMKGDSEDFIRNG